MASAILPSTSTRTGPKSFEIRSNELKFCQPLNVQAVEVGLPAIHVLHTHDDILRFVHEGSIEGYDIWRTAIGHDLQLSYDLFTNLFLCLNVDDL